MRRTDQSWRPSRVHSSENAGLAGAPGFEPGIVGTKNRCLTTWLRPSSRNMPAARGLIGRADGKLNGENGKCRERKVRGTDPPVPADWRRVSSAVGRWHLFTPTAISLPAGSKKWIRLPPGNEKIGLTIVPPAFSTAPSVSSSPVSHMALSLVPVLSSSTGRRAASLFVIAFS